MPSLGRNPKRKTEFGYAADVSEDQIIAKWLSLGYSALAAATAVRSPRIVTLSLEDLRPLLFGPGHNFKGGPPSGRRTASHMRQGIECNLRRGQGSSLGTRPRRGARKGLAAIGIILDAQNSRSSIGACCKSP